MANTKVQSEQIQDGSITAAKLADGTIVAAELADNAVETAAINADAVTGAKIADNAINSEHYTDGSIDTAHIADSQITVGKMAANSVDSDQYVDGSIDTVHIADLQVTTAKIANGNISTAKIADNAVTSAKIDTNIDIAGTFDVTGATTLDSTLAVAGVTTITTADNSDNLTLTSTDADANSGPNLRLYRNSSSPADGDNIGQLDWEGRNDNSQDVVYASMLARVRDNTDGTEDGGIQLDIMKDGSLTGLWKYYSNGTTSEFSINDDSIDMDFRVESNGNANAIFVNGGDDRVTFFNGTTVNAASGTNDGVSHYSDGRTDISRASAQALNLRRRTDDGVIVNFYKEASGTVANVGSIGVGNSNDLTIGTADTGLVFQDNEIIAPFNPSTNALRDAAIDIGYSDRRFKDLYLSGGAYVGGTAAANKLDDYEEGSWNPQCDATGGSPNIGVTINYAKYIKVGGVVHVSCYLSLNIINSGSGAARITNLPFPMTSGQGYTLANIGHSNALATGNGGTTMYVTNGQSYMRGVDQTNTGNVGWNSPANPLYIMMSATYYSV